MAALMRCLVGLSRRSKYLRAARETSIRNIQAEVSSRLLPGLISSPSGFVQSFEIFGLQRLLTLKRHDEFHHSKGLFLAELAYRSGQKLFNAHPVTPTNNLPWFECVFPGTP